MFRQYQKVLNSIKRLIKKHGCKALINHAICELKREVSLVERNDTSSKSMQRSDFYLP